MVGNGLKSAILLATLTGLLVLIGNLLGGTSGMVMAFGFAVLMNMGAYWFSGDVALKMAGAREVTVEEAPGLHAIVDELAAEAGLPKPRVGIIESAAPNAFATGRDPQHAVVAVTTGIVSILNERELKGVLAHELGHVGNRDILVSSIAATIAGAVTMLAQFAQFAAFFGGFGRSNDGDEGPNPLALLVTIIVAPIAATVIQLAISRAREYGADETGARVHGDPLALASALEKLEAASRGIPPMQVNPAAAHLFIVNPLSGQALAGWFSTHPPIAERVKRLRQMAGSPTA